MASGMSTLDLIGFVGPLLVLFLLMIVYYVWEGRREKRLREQYEGS